MSSVPYDRFFTLCSKASERFGMIFDLPVQSQPHEYLWQIYNAEFSGGLVLDFGCGVGKALQKVLGIGDDQYYSCDNDASGSFNYTHTDDIPEDQMFDIIAANQVFEHLTYGEGIEAALSLSRHVRPGGVFEIGVPNPQHPTRQISNPTHITPWNYLNLCALMELGGLDPFLCARSNKHLGIPWWQRPLVSVMCRAFRMDWCDTVYVVGRKPKDGKEPDVESD